MKKLSKNTFSKLFATFLGASTILTPLVTIVSCQPISKSPIIKQQNSNSNKNNNGNGSGTGNTQPGNGSGTGNQPGNGSGTGNNNNEIKPTTPFNDTKGNTITITGSEATGYTLAGSIYIDDINTEEFNKKLDSFKNAHLNTSDLNINCFYEKTNNNTKQQSAITTREIETIAGKTYESKKITPEVLKGVLKLKKGDNIIKLNNKTADGNLFNIPFESSIEKPFDITDLAKFSFSEDFKLAENPKIIVGSTATKQTDASNKDITPYPKVHELLKLLKNKKLKDNITVKDVYITGNVKDLLPLLVEPGRIKEVSGGIKFLNVKEFKCPGPNVTEYDGEKNNTKSLPVEQLIEFHKRTNEMYDTVIKENARSVRLLNLVLENINTTTMNEEQLKFLHFKEDFFSGNILFKDSNLSKIDMLGVQGKTATITFEETILPRDIGESLLATLILKNATLPEELKTTPLKNLLGRIPKEISTLKIYNLQGKFLDKYTEEEIKQVKKQWQNYGNIPGDAPSKYAGPQDVWNKLKLLFQEGKTTKTHFTNEDLTDVDDKDINFSAIKKPQDTFLALVSKNNSRG